MPVIRSLPGRDVFIIGLTLMAVAGLAWYYLWLMAQDMSMVMPSGADTPEMMAMNSMADAAMQPAEWTAQYFLMMLVMWIIMMAGMMLPSVLPVVMIYVAVLRKALAQGADSVQQTNESGWGEPGLALIMPVTAFVLAYLVAWSLFSVLATLLQWWLDEAGYLSSMMAASSTFLAATILAAAGIYQWLPLKESCLRHCQSPASFIASHWRKGSAGAFRMGFAHGVFCLGCCWMLMALLFVGGVMNLVWIAAIMIYVLLEKLLPIDNWLARLAGLLMIIASVFMFLGSGI